MTKRTDESWFLSEVEEGFLSVLDVKDYVYCPRVVYFRRVLHAKEEMGSQQAEARESHGKLDEKEARRKSVVPYRKDLEGGEKSFSVPLVSRRLELQGILDCLVKLAGDLIPIDYKFTKSNRKQAWAHHKYQLVAYAMLVEDNFGGVVKKGFIYYVPEELLVEIPVTQGTREFVKKVLTRIRRIMQSEEPPLVRVNPKRCSCGLRWICLRV